MIRIWTVVSTPELIPLQEHCVNAFASRPQVISSIQALFLSIITHFRVHSALDCRTNCERRLPFTDERPVLEDAKFVTTLVTAAGRMRAAYIGLAALLGSRPGAQACFFFRFPFRVAAIDQIYSIEGPVNRVMSLEEEAGNIATGAGACYVTDQRRGWSNLRNRRSD